VLVLWITYLLFSARAWPSAQQLRDRKQHTMSTVDPSAQNVETLQGLGLTIVVTSIACCIISMIIVGLRSFVRLHEKVFGWDDALMVAGLVCSALSLSYGKNTNIQF
jgi:hypothetical protein